MQAHLAVILLESGLARRRAWNRPMDGIRRIACVESRNRILRSRRDPWCDIVCRRTEVPDVLLTGQTPERAETCFLEYCLSDPSSA